MGGIGSGRLESKNKKEVVENSLCLDVFNLKHEGTYDIAHNLGRIEWPDISTKIDYELNTIDEGHLLLMLFYSVDNQASLTQSIKINKLFQKFGGYHPLFICSHCNGRAKKLYLPSGATKFLCRDCHQLTYMMSQTQYRKGYENIFWDCHAKRRANENITVISYTSG